LISDSNHHDNKDYFLYLFIKLLSLASAVCILGQSAVSALARRVGHFIINIYSKELSMYLLGRNHVDEDDLFSDMVEYERLDMSRSLRIRQVSIIKENTLQKSVTSCPTVVAVKQQDTKVTIERKSASLPRSCFNCGAKIHLSSQCPKPKREKGACYECGSMAHQRGSCPALIRGNDDGKKENSVGLMSIDVIRDQDPPDKYPAPYEVRCQFNVPVEESESLAAFVNAVVDTGSPISIIKSELVPSILYTTQTVSKNHFCDINGAKLDIRGVFETNVIINNFEMYLKLYVVSNYTMKANAILGRDFLNKKGFKIEFKNNIIDIVKLDTGNLDETDVNFNVLAIYSPTADTELHCDSSSTGFGAISFQGQADADNKMKPVFYFSQRSSPNESKFHSFELECLAVVYAIKRFHIFLSGI